MCKSAKMCSSDPSWGQKAAGGCFCLTYVSKNEDGETLVSYCCSSGAQHSRAGRSKIISYCPPFHMLLNCSGFIGCSLGTQPASCVCNQVRHVLRSHAKWQLFVSRLRLVVALQMCSY